MRDRKIIGEGEGPRVYFEINPLFSEDMAMVDQDQRPVISYFQKQITFKILPIGRSESDFGRYVLLKLGRPLQFKYYYGPQMPSLQHLAQGVLAYLNQVVFQASELKIRSLSFFYKGGLLDLHSPPNKYKKIKTKLEVEFKLYKEIYFEVKNFQFLKFKIDKDQNYEEFEVFVKKLIGAFRLAGYKQSYYDDRNQLSLGPLDLSTLKAIKFFDVNLIN